MATKISFAAALVLAGLTAWLYLEFSDPSAELYESKAPSPSLVFNSSPKIKGFQDKAVNNNSDVVINEKEVQLVLRNPELEYHELDDSRSAIERINKLLPLAESGDVVASSIVASELARCNSHKLKRHADRNASIQSMVDDGNYTEKYSLGMSYSIVDGEITNLILNPKSLSSSHEIHQNEVSYCHGIPNSLEAKTLDFAQFAADKGDYPAQKLLLELEYENDNIRYEIAKRLWDETGSVEALYKMSDIQNEALVAENKAGTNITQKPDKVLAFALVLVSSKLSLAALKRDGEEITSDILSSTDQILAYRSQNLSALEYSDAEKLAYEMIAGNPNCCMH